MAFETMAGRVREAAKTLGDFRSTDLSNAVGVQTHKERHHVRAYMRDFYKRGEFARIARGLYRYVPMKKKRTKLDVIWHLARSHRHFSLDDMERLSGATKGTVKEYLSCLVRLGYLKKTALSRWLLVKDPGPETPTNTAKCKRLRRMRRERKTEGLNGRG